MTQIFDELYKLINDRKLSSPEGSYTTELFKAGENRITKKLGEELAELIMASAKNDRSGIIYEASDLIFHMFVLLTYREIKLEEIVNELNSRMKKQ